MPTAAPTYQFLVKAMIIVGFHSTITWQSLLDTNTTDVLSGLCISRVPGR
jgi:hypothetical protein